MSSLRRVGRGAGFATALALILAAGWPLRAGEEAPPPAQEGPAAGKADSWSPLPHFPSESVLVVSLKDAKDSYGRLQETALYKIFTQDDVQQALQIPLMMAKGGMKQAEVRINMQWKEIKKVMQGEVTFGFFGFLEERGEDGKPVPDLMLAIQAHDKMDDLLAQWLRLVDRLNAQTQNTLVQTTDNFAGTEVVTISHPNVPFQITYANTNGVFLVAMGPGRIEKVLAAREASKKAATNPEIKVDTSTLAQAANFRRAREKAGSNSEVFAYVNFDRLRTLPNSPLRPRDAIQERDFDFVGISSIKGLTYNLAFTGKGLRETLYVDAPEKDRKGLLKLPGGQELSADALGGAPKTSVAAVAVQADPVVLWDKLLEVAATFDPNVPEQANAVLEQLGQDLQLDVRKDLMGALTGQALISVSLPSKHNKLGVGFPLPLLALEVKDEALAGKALNAIKRAAADRFDFADVKHGDSTVTVMREKFPEGRRAAQLTWVPYGKRILVSIAPVMLREELDRLAGKHGGTGASLAEDSSYAAARDQVTMGSQGMLYLDTAAVLTVLYDIAIPILQLNPAEARGVNINQLPPASELTQHLTASVLGISTDADGLLLDSYSSTGMATVVVPAVAATAEMVKNVRRRRRNEGNRGELDPQLVEQRQTLRNLHAKLSGYVKEHGQMPADLDELVPQYLGEEFKPKLAQIKYQGAQDQPHRVVAYFENGGAKNAALLLQNGSVKEIQNQKLLEVLEKGYQEARPTAAKPNDAVKPPAPPPDF